jgi:alkanesulfonate monooxygenase SsuD/methylene tetrahydromethanopterin reductase-like flavin-dependent oxidoreductase (luciferase family)
VQYGPQIQLQRDLCDLDLLVTTYATPSKKYFVHDAFPYLANFDINIALGAIIGRHSQIKTLTRYSMSPMRHASEAARRAAYHDSGT